MHDVLQYTVTFENGETKQYPEGTTFLEIAKDRQKEYKNDVVLVLSIIHILTALSAVRRLYYYK